MPFSKNTFSPGQSPVFLARCCRAMPIAICLIPLLLTGCDDSPKVSSPLRPVKTWIIPAPKPTPSLSWTGTLEPSEEVVLQFRLDGKLAARPVDVGSWVKKNQVVATLNGSQSEGEAVAALAEFKDAQAAEQKGRQDLERTKKLYAIGTVSKAQLEEATANLASLEARTIRARAQKDGANNNSDFSVLKAPFDGIVTSYTPYPGQNIAAGQEIIKIASDKVEVQFSLSADIAATFSPGDVITVHYANNVLKGRIRYISPQLDSATLTSRVRASLMSPVVIPKFGSPVAVELKNTEAPVVTLPAASLIRADSHPAVYVVGPHNTLETRRVTIARFTADEVYISSGLKTGERVITAGVNTLENGEKVNVITEAGK